MNKAASASKSNLNHGFPSSEARGNKKNAISTKPKDPRYFEKTNAFVKCISGRRSSDINSVGTKLVPNQGISVHQEQFYYTPTKILQHTKFKKDGLTNVGFMSVPTKQCHGEHNKVIHKGFRVSVEFLFLYFYFLQVNTLLSRSLCTNICIIHLILLLCS